MFFFLIYEIFIIFVFLQSLKFTFLNNALNFASLLYSLHIKYPLCLVFSFLLSRVTCLRHVSYFFSFRLLHFIIIIIQSVSKHMHSHWRKTLRWIPVVVSGFFFKCDCLNNVLSKVYKSS